MTEIFAQLNLTIAQSAALPLFILSLPICIWVAWSDMRAMRIPNTSVLALVAVFIVVAPFVMPLEQMGWQMLHLVVILLVGIVLNAAGLVGAGDAKFAAAAAPFIAFPDARFLIALFAACLLAGYATHRIAKFTPLRRLAPDWESWTRKRDFPMGLPLAATLSIYLLLGTLSGS